MLIAFRSSVSQRGVLDCQAGQGEVASKEGLELDQAQFVAGDSTCPLRYGGPGRNVRQGHGDPLAAGNKSKKQAASRQAGAPLPSLEYSIH